MRRVLDYGPTPHICSASTIESATIVKFFKIIFFFVFLEDLGPKLVELSIDALQMLK